MAYMDQARKRDLANRLKEALAGVDLKYTLAVRHHSTIVMNVKSGSVDFLGAGRNRDRWPGRFEPYTSVNPYWYHEHFTGEAKEVLGKVFGALNTGNHDRSDVMTDYFDVGWYVEVNIGDYRAPYLYTAPAVLAGKGG